MSYSALGAALQLAPAAFPSSSATAPAPTKMLSKPLPGCISQAVHDQAVQECNASQQIKGIGVVGYEQYGNPCRLVTLPICLPIPAQLPVLTPPPPALTLQPAVKQSSMVSGGIIAAVLLGGGYLLYRTLKK